VAPAQATVEYVRAYLPASEGAGKTNRMVSYSYTIPASTADSVGDGIPDWWRAQYYGGNGRGTNTASCATCDPDGDGVSNVLEYLADTNPTNAASYFAIEAVTVNPGNSVLFQSSPNRKYTLQSTTNLNSGAWSDVSSQTAIRGTGGVVSLTDSSPTTTQRFYRVEVRPL
jgi:hypothetical protein